MNKKKLALILVPIVLVAVALLAYFLLTNDSAGSSIDLERDADLSQVEETKNRYSKDDEQTWTGDADKPAVTTEIPDSKTTSILDLSVQQVEGTVNINASVEDIEKNAGTCTFTATKPDNRPVVKQVAATKSGETSFSCTSNIPTIEFSSNGEWKILLTYFGMNSKISTEKTVVIN